MIKPHFPSRYGSFGIALAAMSFAFGMTGTDAQDKAKPKPIALADLKRPADKAVSFSAEIIDILDAKCTGCHNDALAENKLKMETVEQMLKGGKTGPALVAGKADESLMFLMGSHRAEPVMPPADKKDLKAWTPEEAALIKLWIDQGAKDDSDETPPETKPAPGLALAPLPDRFAPIYALDLSPDARTLAVGRGAKLHLVEPVSGFVFKTVADHVDAIGAVRFRPDGGELATGGFKTVARWIVPKVAKVDRWEKVSFAVAQFVPEPGTGQFWAVSPSEPIARLIDLSKKAEVRQIKWLEGKAVAFVRSPFEPFVAVVTDKGVVHVLNSADGKALHKIDPPMGATATAAAWTAKSKLAVGRSDGKIQVIEIADALKPGAEWKGTEGPVRFLTAAADGKSLVACVKEGTLELWDTEAGKSVRSQALAGAPVAIVSRDSRDGTILFGQADGRISAFAADLSAKLAENLGRLAPIVAIEPASAASGVAVVHQDGLVRLLEPASLQDDWAWAAGAETAIAPAVELVAAVRGADDRVWTFGKNAVADAWSVSGNLTALKPLDGMTDRVLTIDYSPDGRKIAVGSGVPSRSGEVKIWDGGTATVLKNLDAIHSDTVLGVRFSPDGRFLASCAADKFAKVTQMSDFKTLRPFEGHTNHVLGVDWKPDGKQLATAGADQALKLWNVETGEQVRTAQQAGKQITSVRWAAGKPIVLGAAGDKQVRFWNPDNGQIARTFAGPTDFLFTATADKDMATVFAAGQDGVVYVFNGADGKLLRTLKFAPPK
jgi:WD40 repeat protein